MADESPRGSHSDCPLKKISEALSPMDVQQAPSAAVSRNSICHAPHVCFACKEQDKWHKFFIIISRVLILSKKNVIFFSKENSSRLEDFYSFLYVGVQ